MLFSVDEGLEVNVGLEIRRRNGHFCAQLKT
jgi:hypothetical protein